MRLLYTIAPITAFIVLWFFEFHAGYCGEISARRIRFAVYEWEGFGDTDTFDWAGILTSLDLVDVSWGGAALDAGKAVREVFPQGSDGRWYYFEVTWKP